MLLTDDIWNSDEIMEVNAEAGLSFDVLAKLSRAVIAAYEAKLREQESLGMTVLDISDDDDLRFVQRVLESNATKADRDAARELVVAIRKRVRKTALIPEGYALVPVEPTEAMVSVELEHKSSLIEKDRGLDTIFFKYKYIFN